MVISLIDPPVPAAHCVYLVTTKKEPAIADRLFAGSPVVRAGRCETTPLSHRRRSRIIAAGCVQLSWLGYLGLIGLSR